MNAKLSQSTLAEPIKQSLFDTGGWGAFCDVSATLKQARRSDHGKRITVDEYECRRACRHFMNLLNRAVYGNAFRNCNKQLRVLTVLEKGQVHSRALSSRQRGTSGRWHVHCAIELPQHLDAVTFEALIHGCWAKVDWGYRRLQVREGTNEGWINYMLKQHQKADLDCWSDCIVLEAFNNPIAHA